jgi:hypothetical protein
MSATEIRKTLQLLNEMAEHPSSGEPQVWIVADNDADAYIFAPNERCAKILAECVFTIEEAGLGYNVIPNGIMTSGTDISSLLTDSDLDSTGAKYNNEKSIIRGSMRISYFPLSASRVKKWCKEQGLTIPSESTVLRIDSKIDALADQEEDL